jgi:cytochrome c-type biogenesis protein
VEVYLGAFAAGIGATITPCILPLYPAFLAYLRGDGWPQHGDAHGSAVRIAPVEAALLVWAGVVTGMVAIGAALAALAAPLGGFNRIVLPIADGVLIVLGVLLLLGVNPFARLPQLSPAALGGRGAALGAFLYGLLFAPIALPCSGPFVVGIFAFSFTIGDAAGRLLFFVVFGLGFGLPLFVLGSLGQVRGRQIGRALARHDRLIRGAMGVVLILVGAWDLVVNASNIIG